jgi:type VI secretion system secreted protein VgrG
MMLQEARLGEFTSPLGKDVLALTRYDGSEALSEPFEYRVECLSQKPVLDYDSAIGSNCCVSLKTPSGLDRHFNGVMTSARFIGSREDLFVHEFLLRPWYWLLTRTSDCRIWHDKTALEIIKEVFRDRDFTDFDDRTTKNYPKLEYCVQYRECDFTYTSRLMEQHGIYYFFEHSTSRHVMVLADSKASHKDVPGYGKIHYYAGPQSRRDQEHFNFWTSTRQFRSGKYELDDYDFKKPSKDLTSRKQASSRYRKGTMEIYDYPGKYVDRDHGELYARVRLEADQSLDRRRHASGNAISLFPGGLTTLQEHSASSENIEYLIVRVSHSYVLQSYRSGAEGETDYSGSYELADASIPFRAALVTPRPIIHGPQTARVVGADGEEIDVDEYGRILVLFHWDRKNAKSCRVRVAQVWAGKKWGGQVIPRIGMEAVVEFLEGDPDRPLVVGTVYNGDNKHPYNVPDCKTQSGLKSDTSLGHNGYNEFMFEDKRGQETIRMHAQKDHEVEVLNQETWKIGKDYMGSDASRSTTLLKGSDELDIKLGNQTVTIALNQKTTANISIKLICGGSIVDMNPGMISLTSGLIQLNAPVVQITSATFTVNSGFNLFAGPIKTPAIFLNAPPVILPA